MKSDRQKAFEEIAAEFPENAKVIVAQGYAFGSTGYVVAPAWDSVLVRFEGGALTHYPIERAREDLAVKP